MGLCHFDNLISEVPGQNLNYGKKESMQLCVCVFLIQKSKGLLWNEQFTDFGLTESNGAGKGDI